MKRNRDSFENIEENENENEKLKEKEKEKENDKDLKKRRINSELQTLNIKDHSSSPKNIVFSPLPSTPNSPISTPLSSTSSSSSSSSSSKNNNNNNTNKKIKKKIPKKQYVTIDGKKYLKVFFQNELRTLPLYRPVRVYADGIFDMFHYGHSRSLQQAKNIFKGSGADEIQTHLIVGVCGDKITQRLKGKTVMTEDERTEAVRHCRYSDEVIKRAPWLITQDFVDKHKIDFVTHGNDLSVDENGNDVYYELKKNKQFLVTKRTSGISTSGLITRIVKNYDEYIKRNIKRGYTPKELNLSAWKKAQVMLDEGVNNVKNKWNEFKETHNIDQKIDKIKTDLKDNINKSWENVKKTQKIILND